LTAPKEGQQRQIRNAALQLRSILGTLAVVVSSGQLFKKHHRRRNFGPAAVGQQLGAATTVESALDSGLR